jgi:hypothetical protein
MQRAHIDAKLRHITGVSDAETMLAHMLDMGRPRIDEGYILAGLHHVCPGVTADRARADKGDPLSGHDNPPGVLLRRRG